MNITGNKGRQPLDDWEMITIHDIHSKSKPVHNSDPGQTIKSTAPSRETGAGRPAMAGVAEVRDFIKKKNIDTIKQTRECHCER
jgi:hypothetical protein